MRPRRFLLAITFFPLASLAFGVATGAPSGAWANAQAKVGCENAAPDVDGNTSQTVTTTFDAATGYYGGLNIPPLYYSASGTMSEPPELQHPNKPSDSSITPAETAAHAFGYGITSGVPYGTVGKAASTATAATLPPGIVPQPPPPVPPLSLVSHGAYSHGSDEKSCTVPAHHACGANESSPVCGNNASSSNCGGNLLAPPHTALLDGILYYDSSASNPWYFDGTYYLEYSATPNQGSVSLSPVEFHFDGAPVFSEDMSGVPAAASIPASADSFAHVIFTVSATTTGVSCVLHSTAAVPSLT
jgi:hypothetical protein